MNPMHVFPQKDPSSLLDYRFDWAAQRNNTGLSDWLDNDETILTHDVIVPPGLTKVSSSIVDGGTAVVVFISGGTDGEDYLVECQISTATRSDTRSALLRVRNR